MRLSRAFAALLLSAALPAAAIELSLEENRAERGNIGYIDMQKVFKLFPETQRAKENFEESVRQTEEQVNLRKAELLRLRAELSQMKADREVLASAPPPAPEPVAPPAPVPEAKAKAPAVKPSPAPIVAPSAADPAMAASEARPELDALLSSTQTVSGLPGFGGTSAQQPLTIDLPGGTTAPVVVQEPGTTAPAATPPPAETPTPIAATPAPAGPSALQLIDERIAAKVAEIARLEAAYKQEKLSAEKNLLDLESRKSELLLGKIYRAVQDVARKEGVSVVVDKGAILYGHNAVDLTDKVLKQLKGA